MTKYNMEKFVEKSIKLSKTPSVDSSDKHTKIIVVKTKNSSGFESILFKIGNNTVCITNEIDETYGDNYEEAIKLLANMLIEIVDQKIDLSD
ncbi:MAG: hypothetical protein ACOC33_00605 [bacterium]